MSSSEIVMICNLGCLSFLCVVLFSYLKSLTDVLLSQYPPYTTYLFSLSSLHRYENIYHFKEHKAEKRC